MGDATEHSEAQRAANRTAEALNCGQCLDSQLAVATVSLLAIVKTHLVACVGMTFLGKNKRIRADSVYVYDLSKQHINRKLYSKITLH